TYLPGSRLWIPRGRPALGALRTRDADGAEVNSRKFVSYFGSSHSGSRSRSGVGRRFSACLFRLARFSDSSCSLIHTSLDPSPHRERTQSAGPCLIFPNPFVCKSPRESC